MAVAFPYRLVEWQPFGLFFHEKFKKHSGEFPEKSMSNAAFKQTLPLLSQVKAVTVI